MLEVELLRILICIGKNKISLDRMKEMDSVVSKNSGGA